MSVVHKFAKQSEDDPFVFILSDETVDRVGDVIAADGWQLSNFKRNPIALFGHDQGFPIGTWADIKKGAGKLIARLEPALKGTSQRIDEIISLIEQRILRAVSVGFRPIEYEPRDGGRGLRYIRQELLETSVVSVPANPASLAVAKSLNISDATMAEVFGENAGSDLPPGTREGGVEAANRSPIRKRATDMNARTGALVASTAVGALAATGGNSLSKKIDTMQGRLTALQDDLEKAIDEAGEEPSDEQNAVIKGFNEKIAETQESLENLVEAEKRLGQTTVERADTSASPAERRPWAAPKEKVEPIDYIFRALTAQVVAHVHKTPLVETMKALYGEDPTTKAVMDAVVVNKAAVAPADTTTSAWAGALVQTAIGDFFELLLPQSVYPRLSQIGGRFGFGRNGTVSLPTRDATPTVAGSFVAEGGAIPVRRAGFSAITLTPKKMAVITTFTREITERSTPAIEQLLRNAIQEDTAVSIDSVLLDANAATAVRPAGLRNGITTAAGTAGGGFAAVVADLKAILGGLITATNGNIRNPVWLMNPAQALALSLTQNAGGDFPFEQEVNGSKFRGYPIIQSTTVPAGVVIIVDAADFFSATGDDPKFDVSDQATLHMEDTTPLAIGTAGAPNTVAAPVRSLFQTDSLALRMILPINWALRRTGVAIERTAVTW
jgi:HK97 family phage major capsid protein/HK97 family phage prohead protease